MKKKVVSLLLVTTMVASLAAGYGMGLHAPGYFNAVPYHDVQTEFEKLPSRYNGGGTN